MAPNRKKNVHEGQSENKDENQHGKDSGRVSWTKELLHLLCDLCIQYVEKSKGKSGEVTSKRLLWKKIEAEFQKKTNLEWDKMKLKNKVDWMRARWGLWKQLKGRETGLGWDPEKGTISATDEWWDLKIKENPKFVAFREEGFEFELETKIDQIFGCYAQGSLKFSPLFDSPQGHLQHESDEVYVPSPPCNDTFHVDLGDMDETHGDDNDYNTWDDVWKESIPTPQDTQFERSEKSRGKRVLEGTSLQSSKSARIETTKKGAVATLGEKLDSLLQIIGERSNVSKEVNMSLMDVLTSMKNPSPNEITDALAKLYVLPGLEFGTPEFFFACTLIEDPKKRSVIFGLPDDKVRVDYIKFLYEKENKH